MVYLLRRGLLLSAVLMFGFILGIIYVKEASSDNISPGFSLRADENQVIEKNKDLFTYKGFRLKNVDENKIQMEDGDGLVIYNYDDDTIRKGLIEGADLHRDLLDKQQYVLDSGDNIFSQLGLKTADAFEGVFRKIFAIVE